MTETIELIAFPGAPNLPIFTAIENGYFAAGDVEVNLTTTPSSVYQIENLASGKFQIAATAVDNVVAYQEGQGAVALQGKPDLFAFMGATQIELSFVVAPEIKTFADLKGKTLALDALATGFAFVLYQMLENAGLSLSDVTMEPVGATPDRWQSVKDGTHAGTLTIEPFTSMARAEGYHVLESSLDTLDHYQGGVFAARHTWADAHNHALKGFISGYLQGLAQVLDPKNRIEAADTLLRNMPAINPGAVDKVLDKVLSPKSGLTPDAAINMDGMQSVLSLRSRYSATGNILDAPARYLDLSHLQDVQSGRQ